MARNRVWMQRDVELGIWVCLWMLAMIDNYYTSQVHKTDEVKSIFPAEGAGKLRRTIVNIEKIESKLRRSSCTLYVPYYSGREDYPRLDSNVHIYLVVKVKLFDAVYFTTQ